MIGSAFESRSERYARVCRIYRKTSGDAWRSVLDHLPAVDQQILICIADGIATCDAIELATGMKHQTVSAQIRHLTEAGLLVDSGERQKTRSGRPATVWALAPRPEPEAAGWGGCFETPCSLPVVRRQEPRGAPGVG